jgi:hypothetical protein
MKFKIIYELEQNDFYLFGSIYLNKKLKKKEDRDRQREMDKIEYEESKKTTDTSPFNNFGYNQYELYKIDYLRQIYGDNFAAASVLENKIVEFYKEEVNNDIDEYNETNAKNEREELMKELISSDELIIIPRNSFFGNKMIDVKKSAMLVLTINDQIKIGFFIDKVALSLFGLNAFEFLKEEEEDEL